MQRNELPPQNWTPGRELDFRERTELLKGLTFRQRIGLQVKDCSQSRGLGSTQKTVLKIEDGLQTENWTPGKGLDSKQGALTSGKRLDYRDRTDFSQRSGIQVENRTPERELELDDWLQKENCGPQLADWTPGRELSSSEVLDSKWKTGFRK